MTKLAKAPACKHTHRPSVLHQIIKRIARIAIMLVICLPSIVLSSHLDAAQHREAILMSTTVFSLVVAFWAMDRLVPMRQARN